MPFNGKIHYEMAVELLCSYRKRLDNDYDMVSAASDYVRRPDIAIGYIKEELRIREKEQAATMAA